MIFYSVLAIATTVIAALSVVVWWKTRQIGFIMGFAVLYYWSLFGAWRVIARGVGSGSSYRFEYLYYKLFPIYLDDYYWWTIVLYTLFIITVQITVLYVVRARSDHLQPPAKPLFISHAKVLAIAGVFVLGAYGIMRNVVTATVESDVPGYVMLTETPVSVPLVSIYQLLHQTSLTFALVGFSVLLSGRNAMYIAGSRRWSAAIGYGLVLTSIIALNVLLGNRSMLLFGAVGAGLFYIVNTRRPNRAILVGGAVLLAGGLVVLGIIRGSGGQREWRSQNAVGKVHYMITEAMAQDTESVAAHASLYGTLRNQVPLTYGSSFLWLAGAVVPRVIRVDLVPLVYYHYATHVGAAATQGFTLHHATGWYLNFGVPGMFLGAVVFAWIWARLFNAFANVARQRSHFARVFATIAFWNFTAYSPILIRNGPEGYKGVALESLLIPTFIMMCASLTVVKRANRPRLVPMQRAPLVSRATPLVTDTMRSR